MANEKKELAVEEMSIYQKLAGIRKMVEVIRKNKAGYNYKYVSEDEILAKVTAGMDKYHVLLYPGIVPQTMQVTPYSYTKVKGVKGGGTVEEKVNEILVNSDMTFTWVNLDNATDTLEVPWTLVGQQSDASQAVGSGLSYLNRYFLLKFFQVATPDDDPDNWRSKKQEAAQQEEQKLVDGMIDEIGAVVSDYLKNITDEAESKKARADLAEVIRKYVKDGKGKPSGDYRNLKDMKTATSLFEAIKKFIGGKEE